MKTKTLLGGCARVFVDAHKWSLLVRAGNPAEELFLCKTRVS